MANSLNLQKNAVRFGSGLSHFSAHLNLAVPCRFQPDLQISILHFYRFLHLGDAVQLGEADPSLTQSLFAVQRTSLHPGCALVTSGGMGVPGDGAEVLPWQEQGQ